MKTLATFFTAIALFIHHSGATSNYTYKPDEFVTVVDGGSPDGHYSIAAHGEGENGYDNFHIYLMNARTGQKIGPLEEIKNILDTGAGAFYAHWTDDSGQVSITYRIERHVAVKIDYRLADGRAYKISDPVRVNGLPGVEPSSAGAANNNAAGEVTPASLPSAGLWITGDIYIENSVLLFRAEKSIDGNSTGNVVLLGTTRQNANSFLPILMRAGDKKMKVRLLGTLQQSAVSMPGPQEKMPDYQFIVWKLHLPTDPDELPDGQKIVISGESGQSPPPAQNPISSKGNDDVKPQRESPIADNRKSLPSNASINPPDPAAPGMLKVSDIRAMSAAGIRSSVIIDAIKESKSAYTQQDIDALLESNRPIDPEVIKYIKNPAPQSAENSSTATGSSPSETSQSSPVIPKKHTKSHGGGSLESTRRFDNL